MIWANTNDTEEEDCSLERYIYDYMKIEKQHDGLKCLASKGLPEVIKKSCVKWIKLQTICSTISNQSLSDLQRTFGRIGTVNLFGQQRNY